MITQASPHNKEDNNLDQYISENCSICEDELKNEKDIYVTTESDQYICKRCMNKYDINAVRCRDI